MVCAARPENRQARADPQSISDSRTSARVGSTAALAAVVQAYWVPVPHARLARRGALEFRRHLRRFWRLVLQGKGEVCLKSGELTESAEGCDALSLPR